MANAECTMQKEEWLRRIVAVVSLMVLSPWGWSVGRLVGWSVGQLVSWSVSQLVGWSVGQLVGWSVGRLVSWSVGRLVGWSVSRLRNIYYLLSTIYYLLSIIFCSPSGAENDMIGAWIF